MVDFASRRYFAAFRCTRRVIFAVTPDTQRLASYISLELVAVFSQIVEKRKQPAPFCEADAPGEIFRELRRAAQMFLNRLSTGILADMCVAFHGKASLYAILS